jgi:hypothetical protein
MRLPAESNPSLGVSKFSGSNGEVHHPYRADEGNRNFSCLHDRSEAARPPIAVGNSYFGFAFRPQLDKPAGL